MRVVSQERFGGACDTGLASTTTMRLHKQGEAEGRRPSDGGHGHGRPPSPRMVAPCGVGVLEGARGYAEEQCRQGGDDASSAARCDCGQHTFLVLPPPQDGSLDTAPATPDLSSSSSSSSSNSSIGISNSIREKRGRVATGETPTSSSRRHLVMLPETGSSSSSAAAAAADVVRGCPADIENLSASMVQAMARKGSTGGTGSASSSSSASTDRNDSSSANSTASGAPLPPPPLGMSSQQQQQQQKPQDHHQHPDEHHHHPHQQQQQHHHHQRRRSSVSGADGSSNDGSSGLVGGNAGEPGALSLDRIVVERNGDMVVVESSVVCDACPSCDDVCTLLDCRGCQEKRERLLARGLMVVIEAWGRTTRKESVQQQSPEGGSVCMPIITIAKPRANHNNNSNSSNNSSSTNTTATDTQHVFYSLCEIRRHRTLASCWLVAKGQVYDVTSYLSSHPAGAIAIARKAGGQDCSEDFEFHSGKAQKLWKHLRIGSVKACPAEGRCGGGGRGGEGGSSRRGRSGTGSEGGSLVGSSCSVM